MKGDKSKYDKDRYDSEEENDLKKRWERRHAWMNDYEKDENGKYVYVGKTYIWEAPRKATLGKLWLFSLLIFGAQIAAGLVPAVGMTVRPWVLLPYMFAVAFSVSVLWGAYELTDGGDPLRDYNYKKSVKALPFRGLMTSICSGLAVISELVNVLWRSQYTGSISGALLYILAEAFGFVFGLLLRNWIRALSWEESETSDRSA